MKTRIRMHQMPGDIPKAEKIQMLEGKHPNKKHSKSFKKMLLARERSLEKRRILRFWKQLQDDIPR